MRLNKASITGFFCCFGTILFGIATNGGIKTILNFLHVPSLIVTMGGNVVCCNDNIRFIGCFYYWCKRTSICIYSQYGKCIGNNNINI